MGIESRLGNTVFTTGLEWLVDIRHYEQQVLSARA